MTHYSRREGHIILVAGIALRSSWNVTRDFPRRRRAIVAGRAISGGRRTGSGMIETGWLESHGRMALIALRRRRKMGRGFSERILCGVSATVTSRAIARRHWPGGASVAHGCGSKCGVAANVAHIALGGRGDVVSRFAERCCSIVAG